MIWMGSGMARISNRKPERMKAGRKVTTMAICPATNWFFAAMEISSPMPSATSMKSAPETSSSHSEPRSGTSNSQTASSTVNSRPPMPSTK